MSSLLRWEQQEKRSITIHVEIILGDPEELFSPFFTFLHTIFFRPFRLSLAPTICPWVSEDVSKSHTVFLLLSHSFGIEKISTFVHSRSSLENHTWFQTKKEQSLYQFSDQTAQKPYPLVRHIYIYGIYKGVSPWSWSLKKYPFRAEPKIFYFMPNSRLFFGRSSLSSPRL